MEQRTRAASALPRDVTMVRQDKWKDCLKIGVVVFNVLVFIVGGTTLGFGLYTLLAEYGSQTVSTAIGNDVFRAASYTLIIGGATVLFASACGCCGAKTDNRCLLGCYFSVTLFLLLFFIAASVLGFVFREQITDQLKTEARETLVYKYGVDLDRIKNVEVTKAWDDFQKKLECCGVYGNVESNTSWAIYKLSTRWYKKFPTGKPYVPASCCVDSGHLDMCTGMVPLPAPPVLGPGNLNSSSNSTNPHLHTQGCYEKVVRHIERLALIIGFIALASFLVMLLGMLFAVCLCRNLTGLMAV